MTRDKLCIIHRVLRSRGDWSQANTPHERCIGRIQYWQGTSYKLEFDHVWPMVPGIPGNYCAPYYIAETITYPDGVVKVTDQQGQEVLLYPYPGEDANFLATNEECLKICRDLSWDSLADLSYAPEPAPTPTRAPRPRTGAMNLSTMDTVFQEVYGDAISQLFSDGTWHRAGWR